MELGDNTKASGDRHIESHVRESGFLHDNNVFHPVIARLVPFHIVVSKVSSSSLIIILFFFNSKFQQPNLS